VQVVLKHPGGDLCPRAEIKLSENVGHVSLGCGNGDDEVIRYLAIGSATRD